MSKEEEKYSEFSTLVQSIDQGACRDKAVMESNTHLYFYIMLCY